MIFLTVDEIIELHSKLVLRTGGSDGVRDRGLVESAVYNTASGFGGEEFYPSLEEKTARLMYSLVNNHAFVDGNKRIGVFVMLVTLKINGTELQYSQKELVDLGLGTADGTLTYEDILEWINNHKN